MSFFHLNVETCKKDGICSRVCVAGIIKNDENHLPFIDPAREQMCIACGLCVAYCPSNSCYVEKLDPEQFQAIDKSKYPTGEQVDLVLKTRRSVRAFKKAPVDKDLITTVFDTARYAPSAKNTQNVRWSITKDSAETDKIRELMASYFEEAAKVTPAPESIIMKTMVRAYKQGKDIFLRGAPHLVVAIVPNSYEWKEDAVIALTFFETSSFAHGLGTCWAGYFTRAARTYKPLRDAMGLKDDEYIGGAVMFGTPVYRPYTTPSRNPLNLTWI